MPTRKSFPLISRMTSLPADFDTYLKEKYGIDLSAPIDWNAPDKGGMTPAQKVLSDAREEAIRTGVLMSRQKDYPLTEDQRAELELSPISSATWAFPRRPMRPCASPLRF